METQLSQLVDIYRNEETLSYQTLTNPDTSNPINLTHDSCCFGNQDSYTPILEYPLEKISHLEKSIEILQEFALQFQKSSSQSIDRMESQLSQLVKIYRNEETRTYQPLTDSDICNSIDLTQNSCYFRNQDSYTPFLENSLEEKSHLEKSIEILQESALQFKKSSSQSIDRLETQLSQLVKIYRNEKTLFYNL